MSRSPDFGLFLHAATASAHLDRIVKSLRDVNIHVVSEESVHTAPLLLLYFPETSRQAPSDAFARQNHTRLRFEAATVNGPVEEQSLNLFLDDLGEWELVALHDTETDGGPPGRSPDSDALLEAARPTGVRKDKPNDRPAGRQNNPATKWSFFHPLGSTELSRLFDYFGGDVTSYFVFVRCFNQWLLLPALLGFFLWATRPAGVTLDTSVRAPFYAMFVVLSACVFVRHMEREGQNWALRKNILPHLWGVREDVDKYGNVVVGGGTGCSANHVPLTGEGGLNRSSSRIPHHGAGGSSPTLLLSPIPTKKRSSPLLRVPGTAALEYHHSQSHQEHSPAKTAPIPAPPRSRARLVALQEVLEQDPADDWTRAKLLGYLLSTSVTLFMLSLAFGAMLLSLNLQGYIAHSHTNPFHLHFIAQFAEPGHLFDPTGDGDPYLYGYITLLPTVLHAIMIQVLNAQYKKVATWLTEKELHAFSDDFENSLLTKRFLFEAFDCYIVLFYIAFYERDVVKLRSELVALYCTDCLIRVGLETLLPAIMQGRLWGRGGGVATSSRGGEANRGGGLLVGQKGAGDAAGAKDIKSEIGAESKASSLKEVEMVNKCDGGGGKSSESIIGSSGEVADKSSRGGRGGEGQLRKRIVASTSSGGGGRCDDAFAELTATNASDSSQKDLTVPSCPTVAVSDEKTTAPPANTDHFAMVDPFTSARAQLELEEYEAFDDWLALVIEFGYVTLFAGAFPLAAPLSLLANALEVISDRAKLLYFGTETGR